VAQIPKESIEQVLSATDIVDLINSYVPLKRAGSAVPGELPVSQRETPSFYVNPARQSFNCFGCGKGGDAITFVRDYENLPFMDAVRKLAGRSGVQIREEENGSGGGEKRKSKGRMLDLHREATEFFHELLLKAPEAAHARDYLKSRGFGKEMAANWTVGWMPENTAVFLRLGERQANSPAASWWTPASVISARRESALRHPRAFPRPLMFPVCNEIGDVIAFSGANCARILTAGNMSTRRRPCIFRKSKVLFAWTARRNRSSRRRRRCCARASSM
jgi:DNA primase